MKIASTLSADAIFICNKPRLPKVEAVFVLVIGLLKRIITTIIICKINSRKSEKIISSYLYTLSVILLVTETRMEILVKIIK